MWRIKSAVMERQASENTILSHRNTILPIEIRFDPWKYDFYFIDGRRIELYKYILKLDMYHMDFLNI